MNNNIDDILTRLQGQQPVIDNPEELTDSIMNSLPEQDEIVTKEHKSRLVPITWRWVAAAACLLIIIGVGVSYQFSDSTQPQIAKVESPKVRVEHQKHVTEVKEVEPKIEKPQVSTRIAKVSHATKKKQVAKPENIERTLTKVEECDIIPYDDPIIQFTEEAKTLRERGNHVIQRVSMSSLPPDDIPISKL